MRLALISLAFLKSLDLLVASSKCEQVHITHCQNIGYNSTNMDLSPLGFYSQDESGIQLNSYYELFTSGCTPATKTTMTLLVCSLYTPTCIENYDQFVPPCRELCEKAKTGCVESMHAAGIEWPSAFNCDNFPSIKDTSRICLPEHTVEPAALPTTSRPKVNYDKKKQQPSPSLNSNTQQLPAHHVERVPLVVSTGNCLQAAQNQPQIRQTITIFEVAIVVLFIVFSIIGSSRYKTLKPDFEWPIWIIFFILLSHVATVLIKLVSKIPAVKSTQCSDENTFIDQRDNTQAPPGTLCVTIATFDYFFTMAAASYWSVFTLSLWLTTLTYSKYAESFVKSSAKVHGIALVLPFLQTAIILTQRPISSESSFPVMCKIGGNYKLSWLMPLSFYYSLGFGFAIVMAVRYWKIHGTRLGGVCSFSGSSSPNSTNALMNHHAVAGSNSSGSGNEYGKTTKFPSFSQRKYAEKFEGCILRLSIYLIGYTTFSSIYLFSVAGRGSLNANSELIIFLSLVDVICIFVLVVLSGIWTCKQNTIEVGTGKSNASSRSSHTKPFSQTFAPQQFTPMFIPAQQLQHNHHHHHNNNNNPTMAIAHHHVHPFLDSRMSQNCSVPGGQHSSQPGNAASSYHQSFIHQQNINQNMSQQSSAAAAYAHHHHGTNQTSSIVGSGVLAEDGGIVMKISPQYQHDGIVTHTQMI